MDPVYVTGAIGSICAAIGAVSVQVRIVKVRRAELALEKYKFDVDHGVMTPTFFTMERERSSRELARSPDDS